MDEGGIGVILNIAAAWEFVEKNKGKINWDLVVLNPPFVSFSSYTLISPR
jgi:methylase of polypeptide subunit release factors